MAAIIDEFLDHPVWRNTHRARLIQLAEGARTARRAAGDLLFKQFHPADQFSLLYRGMVAHEAHTQGDIEAWPMGRVSWPWAALGWSGFLPPQRNGTTARALTDVDLLSWPQEALARIFYADPLLAVDFFRIVLDSARRQFDWVRSERLAAQSGALPAYDAPAADLDDGEPQRRRFRQRLINVLRRSAFFERFEDRSLARLAANAELVCADKDTQIVRQDDDTDGLWVLAAGQAVGYFRADDVAGDRLSRFRTVARDGGIIAGLPRLDGGYSAEATVLAASTCWFYRIPAASIERHIADDPEFGRSYMQRHLARLAHLISAARTPKPYTDEQAEIAAVKSILEQNQARIPVTSDLHKVPHLLRHRLTTGNAFACLGTVLRTGSYQERSIASTCTDLLSGVQAELHFYRGVLDAYVAVADAPRDTPPEELRMRCDEHFARAFGHLASHVRGLERLPDAPGHIVIMNHLRCPAYYRLPNDYHVSFDTAFVSMLLSQRYGAAPVRVVRRSPGREYGHDLFYRRLGHVTVPTAESGIDGATPDVLEHLRRESAAELMRRGCASLARGQNVLICPEGQSQEAHRSPAQLRSGAFRLALAADPEPYIVPVAIAGFDQRYKDTRLVAIVQAPFRLSEAMRRRGTTNLRVFLDDYRKIFAAAVREAQRISQNPLGRQDEDSSAASSSRASRGGT
jgi:1-acyl-sn-glycerol-3-phosphate acyltransferase/CRP-like cAMP-binding protein